MPRYEIARRTPIADEQFGTPLPIKYNMPGAEGDEFQLDTDGEGEDVEGDEDAGEELPTPEYVTFTQVTRQAADGRTVVDVYVDVEDIPGIIKYDIHLTVE